MDNSSSLLDARFIRELWSIASPDDFVEFRFLYYETFTSKPTMPMSSKFLRVRELLESNVEEFLHKIRLLGMEKGLNVHPGINPRFRQGGTDNDVNNFVAVYADIDLVKRQLSRTAIERQLDWMSENDAPPSVLLESGNGLHAYWLLDKPYTREAVLPVMRALESCLSGDNIANASRIMRLPGTQNVKDRENPKECRAVSGNWGRFGLDQFGFLLEEYGEDSPSPEEETPGLPPPQPKESISKLLQGVPSGFIHSALCRIAGNLFWKGFSEEEVWERVKEWNQKNSPPGDLSHLRKQVAGIAKKEKARESSHPRHGFSGKKFVPGKLADHIRASQKLISTPKTNSGRGGEICYLYRDGTFVPHGSDYVAEETHRILSQYEESRPSRIAEVLAMIKIIEAMDHSRINHASKELINVKNGMLDWKKGTLVPHDPKFLCTFQINASFDPNVKSDLLDSFFDETFNEDAIPLVEEFMGYLLIPDTRFQKCVICLGPGGNGKSTFLTMLELFLGPGTVSFESLHDLETNIFTRAGLLDKLANFHHEVSSAMLESTGIFKSVVSGDTISAQLKHQNPFVFTPFCRLVFSANEFPRTIDRTESYYQRLLFVEFPKTFRGAKGEIPDYARTACSDPVFRSAFLNRAVTGLKRLMENGKFTAAKSSERLVEEYREANASSTQAFLQSCFDLGPSFVLKRSGLYEAYNSWARNNGMKPVRKTKFISEICSQRGIEKAREDTPRRERVYVGLKWKPQYDPALMQAQIDTFGNPMAQEESDDF